MTIYFLILTSWFVNGDRLSGAGASNASNSRRPLKSAHRTNIEQANSGIISIRHPGVALQFISLMFICWCCRVAVSCSIICRDMVGIGNQNALRVGCVEAGLQIHPNQIAYETPFCCGRSKFVGWDTLSPQPDRQSRKAFGGPSCHPSSRSILRVWTTSVYLPDGGRMGWRLGAPVHQGIAFHAQSCNSFCAGFNWRLSFPQVFTTVPGDSRSQAPIVLPSPPISPSSHSANSDSGNVLGPGALRVEPCAPSLRYCLTYYSSIPSTMFHLGSPLKSADDIHSVRVLQCCRWLCSFRLCNSVFSLLQSSHFRVRSPSPDRSTGYQVCKSSYLHFDGPPSWTSEQGFRSRSEAPRPIPLRHEVVQQVASRCSYVLFVKSFIPCASCPLAAPAQRSTEPKRPINGKLGFSATRKQPCWVR